ncbi:MBL fold metallo-hydrolase [Hydrogenimonas urashimensis]|uniref:MBL fold metallo-hydrolase n=1 Tax=Hydrogenimonas urashimensis TaxID=2740515 RepID=UPI001915A1D8|nr:MBL fold metallo-hydrolase [Hydrogenimonas urashimensis]
MIRFQNGRFVGKYDTSDYGGVFQILKWKLFYRRKNVEDGSTLKPVDMSEKLASKEDFLCWISHASFLVQLNHKRILIDPVFGNIPFYRRAIPAAYAPHMLGKIDYLLISHTHYDHFDAPSIAEISKTSPVAIVPLRMDKPLKRIVPKLECIRLGWYECHEQDGIKITLVPARHWGRRGLFDKNRVLWGGYIIQSADITIYFAGDTAVGEHFQEIGKRFSIDWALLPIGAYEPEFVMKHHHLNPEEAFGAYRQLGAKKMIPMHYGTFRLSDEPLGEPLKRIEKIAATHPGMLEILKPGEVMRL